MAGRISPVSLSSSSRNDRSTNQPLTMHLLTGASTEEFWHEFLLTPHMNGIRDIRKALGVSQRVFARMLGLSHGLLARCELGQRRMPSDAWNLAKALLRAHQVRDCTPDDPGVVAGKLQSRTSTCDELKEMLRQHRYSLMKHTLLLSDMQQEHEEARKGLNSIVRERNIFKLPSAYRSELDRQYEFMLAKYCRTDIHHQEVVELKIALANAAIASIETLMSNI